MSTVSPKTAGLVTIRYVVMQVLNRLQDYSMKQYKRLTQIALEGFGELNLFHLDAGLEVVYLHMSIGKTVDLPGDFIDYTKIGFPVNGKLRVITKHDNLLLPRLFDDTDVAVGNADAGEDEGVNNFIFFQDHFRNGQFIGGLYGLPGGLDTAFYRVDKEHRQIVFSGTTPRSEIVLEYISDGVKADGSSLIPREALGALRTYILWQKDENDSRVPLNAKLRLEDQHEKAIEALRSFQNAFTADEYKRMVWSTVRQSIKR